MKRQLAAAGERDALALLTREIIEAKGRAACSGRMRSGIIADGHLSVLDLPGAATCSGSVAVR